MVSSSSVLKAHQHGKEIDGADRVVRMNGAPVGGEYLAMVGARRDIEVLEGDQGAISVETDATGITAEGCTAVGARDPVRCGGW